MHGIVGELNPRAVWRLSTLQVSRRSSLNGEYLSGTGLDTQKRALSNGTVGTACREFINPAITGCQVPPVAIPLQNSLAERASQVGARPELGVGITSASGNPVEMDS